jgi:hypothetical protein
MKTLIFLLFPLLGFSQTYEKTNDEYLKENSIRYYDRQAGIIIQKITINSGDTSSVFYELGLIVTKGSRSSDDFMKKAGLIVFEDKSFLRFNDQIYFTYLMEGKHQYSLKHRITDDEFKMLQTKKIDFISVANYSMNLDKWQKQTYLKVFKEIQQQ